MRLAAQITGFFRCMSMSVFAIQNFKIRGKTLPTYWNRTFLLLACQTQEEGIADKIAVVTTISTYRERIVKLQREIRILEDEQGPH